jgi:hypothetical protein
MDAFLNVFVQLLPYLILSGTAIYIFHEYTRFLKDREAIGMQRQASQSESAHVQKTPVNAALAQLQLQAAERFALYLERIAPDRLVMRIHQNGMSAKMLQSEMLRSVREEFDHNLSQQIYVSNNAWELIKNAKDEMVKFISATGESMRENSTGIEMSRKMFEMASRVEKMPNDMALMYLRKETQALLKG